MCLGTRILFALSAVSMLVASSESRAAIMGVQNVVTSVDGAGNRAFISAGFIGSTTTFDASNIGTFIDGKLMYGSNTYGWNDLAPRDVSTSGNVYPANPDRADWSSPFAAEGLSKGTLGEVFGGNNLSHIIDSEDNAAWKIDLLFGPGLRLYSDGMNNSPELAIFERGGNSDLGIKGILFDGVNYSYTSGLVLLRSQFTYAGWTLDTLEISGAQKVYGLGLDLTDLGDVSQGLVGIRLYSEAQFNGPDIVGVLTGVPVPEPGTLALLTVALPLLGRPVRRATRLRQSAA